MAKIKSVQAADPGVGFLLEFDNGELSGGNTLPNLVVNLSINTPQGGVCTSSVSIANTISNTDNSSIPTMVFVVPFGDTAYAPGQMLTINFNVTYSSGSQLTTLLSYSETVQSQGGNFIAGLGS